MATARRTRSTQRTAKRIEPQLDVLIEIHGALIKAGDLALHEEGGAFHASFAYAPAYIDLARAGRAFALDPLNLPLREEPFETSHRYAKLGVLFDAAPDAWGRAVMASDEGLHITALAESRILLKGRGSGVGAIMFAPVGAQVLRPDGSDLPTLADIDRINDTVAAIDSGIDVDEAHRAMLMSSWDMGGARPKTVVRDDDGAQWIVKFPRQIDRTYSRQRNEWANLEMAREIGIRAPATRLIDLARGDCALLIRRFDRGEGAPMRRQHYLSAVSLISPPADFDKRRLDTPYGASIFSYARIADVIRAVSANVGHELQALFARMILNILIHNTDDHLKNTGFLMQAGPGSGGFGYRLSPLFDVVTQESALKHMLHLGPGLNNSFPAENGRLGSLDNARAGARLWGLKPVAVDRIIERVVAVVARRREFYLAAGMNEREIDAVERWVRA